VAAVNCPFCSSPEVERVAQWGGQIITAQWRCGACNSYFEAVREDFGSGGEELADGLGELVAEERLGPEGVAAGP
jgi:hypothetical protein